MLSNKPGPMIRCTSITLPIAVKRIGPTTVSWCGWSGATSLNSLPATIIKGEYARRINEILYVQ